MLYTCNPYNIIYQLYFNEKNWYFKILSPVFKSCYQNKHLFKEQVQTLSLERLCNLISFSVLFSYHSFLPISQYMPTKPPTFPRSPRAVLSNCNLHMNNLEIVLKCIFLLSRPWKAFEFIFVSYLFL